MSFDVRKSGERWAVSSVAETIAESSPVPTLAVRDPAAFDAWDWTKERLKVLLALDCHPTSDVVLRWNKVFCVGGPCDLVSYYVKWRMLRGEDNAASGGQLVYPPAW